MKKILYSVLALAMAAFTFTSCEDVPMPYDDPNNNGGGGSSAENVIFSEDFENGQGGFTFSNVNLASGLSYVWKVGSNNGSNYLVASAFANSQSYASEAWAVSPAINLSDCTKATLTFRHAINKLEDTSRIPDMMTLWASTDYNGNAAQATWTKLEIPTYPAGTSWTFVDAGEIDLADYCGKSTVFIGFKYMSETGLSGSWEIDEFEITGDGTPMSTEDPTPGDTKEITIAELIGKMDASGAVIDATSDRTFEAVVQCDVTGGNNTRNNLPVAIEGATAPKSAVTLYGSQVDPATLGLAKGDKVKITLKAGKAKAQDYNGLWEVTGGREETWCEIEKVGTANITPVVIPNSDIASLTNYQGMTVTIKNATTTESNNWGAGTHTFTAGGTNFTVYANNACSFANNTIDNTKTGDVTGVVTMYGGAAQIAPRTEDDVKTFSVPGEGGGEDKPQPSGEGMTANDIQNNGQGSVALSTNKYDAQNVTDESTWYTWAFKGMTYKGAKICISDGKNGKGIQMQGNASDASKQGFIFNSTAFSSDIKSITLKLSTSASSKYDPSYSFYVGGSAHPTSTKIEKTSANKVVEGDYNVYTEVYDLSSQSCRYFTIWNNLVGALYIEEIIVTLK